MKSFTVTTLGCKVNRYESESISEQLEDLGWQRASKAEPASLCIINTCTVTRKAAMQTRQAVRKAIRGHPQALIVVTGCYAQVAPRILHNIKGVHYVVGHTFKDQIPSIAEKHYRDRSPATLVADLSDPCPFQDMPVTRFGSRTRPFLKIQDGCDAFCAYCIIPHARGRSRSLEPEKVVERIEGLKGQGYAEVVLCGINLGRYGLDLSPPASLGKLIHSIDRSRAIRRLRLSSIEPTEISEELIAQLKDSDRVCPHLHIPLQSGDKDVLTKMNRHYEPGFYRDLVCHVVTAMPDVAIGVDVLVGFPGETEQAFENTCRLIEELPIAYLHVFPFSLQKGTAAESLNNRLSPQIIKKRAKVLRGIGQAKRTAFYEKFMGKTLEVLIEGRRDKKTGLLKGFSDNYIPVHVKGEDDHFNKVVEAKPTTIKDGKVIGKLLAISKTANDVDRVATDTYE